MKKNKIKKGYKRIYCDNCNSFEIVPDNPVYNSVCVICKHIRIKRFGKVFSRQEDRRFV